METANTTTNSTPPALSGFVLVLVHRFERTLFHDRVSLCGGRESLHPFACGRYNPASCCLWVELRLQLVCSSCVRMTPVARARPDSSAFSRFSFAISSSTLFVRHRPEPPFANGLSFRDVLIPAPNASKHSTEPRISVPDPVLARFANSLVTSSYHRTKR